MVVGVSGGCDHTHAGSARLFSRVALATTGCVPFLQKRTPTLEQLLTHELAHVFGAFHPAPGVRSMMRGGDADVWDGQTLRVMRLMRGFDFRRGIDGVDQAAVAAAMRTAIQAAAGEGVLAIDAGNYGGRLGKYPIRLHDLFT